MPGRATSAIPTSPRPSSWPGGATWRQDWINRGYLQTEEDHPQTRTFDAGVSSSRTNAGYDNWFLHLETFDPHEPFFTYKQYKDLYPHDLRRARTTTGPTTSG